jgi:alkylation response protein AidB-like acyl-CoA dehydrogenase
MPQMIFDDPDGALAMLRDSVTGFAERHPGARTLRAKRAEGRDFAAPVWAAMAEAGWTGLMLPEALGGSGLGLAEQAVLSEALGRALICEPLAMNAVFPSALLAGAPMSPERDRLSSGLATGDVVVGTAWRAPRVNGWGSNEVATLASASDGYVFGGQICFVDAANSATDFLVVAEAPRRGAALLSIPAGTSGLTIATRPGVDGAGISNLTFSDLWIPTERVLAWSKDPETLLEQAVIQGRVAIAAELAGLACRAVEMTIAYVKQRIQFGKPIASFQAIQHRLVDMWSDAEFACSAVVNAVETAVRSDRRATALSVLAAKARAGDAAYSICRRAVHLHGAMGFTDESDIGLYLKRAINLNSTLGQPEALRLQFVELERAA